MADGATRSRKRTAMVLDRKWTRLSDVFPDASGEVRLFTEQSCIDSKHPWGVRHMFPNMDIGGPLALVKQEYADTCGEYRAYNLADVSTGSVFEDLRSYLMPTNPGTGIWGVMPWNPRTQSEINNLGSRAINASLPSRREIDLATTLGEMREGLPKIVGARTWEQRSLSAKNAGHEYLNVEFGWKPLIRDIKKFYTVSRDLDKKIKALNASYGKHSHMSYQFPDEQSNAVVRYDNQHVFVPGSTAYSFDYPTSGRLVISRQSTRRTWFEGCVIHHAKIDADGFRRSYQAMQKVYGVEINPATLWNLAPWAWLTDWQFNVGTILANMSMFAADSIFMHYGYLMTEDVNVIKVSHEGSYYSTRAGTMTFTTTVKNRAHATPFGFGLDPSSFSARQWAILGALGSTKTPGQLPKW